MNVNNEEETNSERRFLIYKANAWIFILYTAVIFIMAQFGNDKSDGAIMVGIFMIFAIGAQSGINILISIIEFFRKKKDAGAFLLSGFVVLLIGTGTCFGIVSAMGLF